MSSAKGDGKGNGDSGETVVTQPKTSTPKLSTKARSGGSLGQSNLSCSGQSNVEPVSQTQAQSNNVLSTSLPSSSRPPSSTKSVKFDKHDKPDIKRRREETLSSQGSSSSLGASMMVDEMTVKHDELKNMIDIAVNDALKVAMAVASSRLEAALKNIFTERIDLLESRVFDVEQTVENNVRILHDHKAETDDSVSQCEQRIRNNERSIFENELYISDMELKVNDLEQYTRRNSIRIHGMQEQRIRGRENTLQLVSNFLYDKFELEPDIEIAHRVGGLSRNSTQPRSIIVKFMRRSDKMEIMLRRKHLKGSGISISDDLTIKNVRLIKQARTNERIEAAWSWDGKVYARGINGHRLLLHPGINIDAELDKLNRGV
ncbi:MAG: hypothetical protein AB2693_25450 [Candidatus Thiodiazotropha sp.]